MNQQHRFLTCGCLVGSRSGGGGRGVGWRVAGLIRDDRLDDHLRFERSRADVRVSDGHLSGYERPAFIAKVPVEGDVCVAEVLAGVMEGHGEGDGSVLHEAHVSSHDVIDLVQGDGEGDLI